MANRLSDASVDLLLNRLNNMDKPVTAVMRIAIALLLLEMKEQRLWKPSV